MARPRLGGAGRVLLPLAGIGAVYLFFLQLLSDGLLVDAAFVVVTILTFYIGIRAELAARDHAEAGVRKAYAALRAVDRVTEVALADLSLDDLLDELLDRICRVMSATRADVLLLTDDGTTLETRASTGVDEGVETHLRVPVGEGVAGKVAATGQPMIVDGDSTEIDSDALRNLGAGSMAASPLVIDGEVTGVLRVSSEPSVHFTDDDLRVLQLAADRAAAAISRARLSVAREKSRLGAEHARRHLALLAEASAALDRMLEHADPALEDLAAVVVPAFADWFAVDLVEAGANLRRVAIAAADTTVEEHVAELESRYPGRALAGWRAVATGRPLIVHDAMNPPADTHDDEREQLEVLAAAGFESVMVVPIRARGLSIGVLTFATARPRRGFRPSDLAAADDLGGRVAAALERVALYRETEEAARRAAEHAARLRRLMEASLAVNAVMSREQVLNVLTEQARRVTGADAATTVLVDEGTELSVSDPPGVTATAEDADAGALLHAPLTGGDGRPIGEIQLRLAGPGEFGEDDESILVSLAQMGAVATENARLYEMVRASEARLQALVDASPLAILELGPDGSVLQRNRAAVGLFGGDRHFPSRTDDKLGELFERVVQGATVADVEVTGRRGDGRPVSLAVSMAPLTSEGGAVAGVMAVVADITARKRLEEQVMSAQRMEAVSRLAGGLAHDFNNLLTVIRGYSELLLLRMEDDHPFRDDIGQVKDAGQRAADLTSQLLTLSRRQVVQPAVLEVDEVVHGLDPILRRVVGDDVAVELLLNAGDGTVRADRGQLEQSLLNLAINARDAMPGGGRLAIETSLATVITDNGQVTSGPPPGDYVRIRVSDTGVGMDAETLEHCFEPFFTATRPGRVKGLELATVQGIVTQNGGHISAASPGDDGVTFVIDLPRVSEAADDGFEDDEVRAPEGGTERVLLVEDEDGVRALARESLQRLGYRVVAAGSGPEALRLAERDEEPIDLLLTDVVMPQMNGSELAARLADIRPDVPVLYISGYTEGVLQARGTLDEGVRFLAKPFHPDDLAREVRRALDEAKAARPS